MGKARAAAGAIVSAFALGALAPAALAQTADAWRVGAPVTSLDPHYHQLSPNNAVADMIFDKLVKTDDQARLVPGLADRVARGRADVWEFKLRPASASTTATPSPPRTSPSPSRGAERAEQPVLLRGLCAADHVGRDRRSADHPLAHRQPYPLLPLDLSNVRILDKQTHESAATEDFNSRPRRDRHRPVSRGVAPQRRPHRVRAQRRLLGRAPGLRST